MNDTRKGIQMSAGTSRLDAVAYLLGQLDGQTSFRVAGGRLGARLREAVMAELDGDTVESLADRDYDIFVSMDGRDGGLSVIDSRLECEGAEYAAEVALADLSARQLHEISLRLQALIEARSLAGKGADARVTIRRKAESDGYDILQATRKLQVTAEWLKSAIPCTDYRHEESGGRKTMRDCVWSRELIDRLCLLREGRLSQEDKLYVAAACCDGDLGWAHDIVLALRKPESKMPEIKEKFVPRIKAQLISRQFVNEPAPKRKKKSAETDE